MLLRPTPLAPLRVKQSFQPEQFILGFSADLSFLYTIAGRIREGHLCTSAALREIIPEVRWRQTLSEIVSRKAAKLAKKNPMQPRASVKRV